MICIVLNNTKKKILMHSSFSIVNRSDEYSFLSNREQWYAYMVDIIDTKLLKTKTTKDFKTGPNTVLLTLKIKVLMKFIYLPFCCQDVISQLSQ